MDASQSVATQQWRNARTRMNSGRSSKLLMATRVMPGISGTKAPAPPYGHGRLDAVGSIFNEVVAAVRSRIRQAMPGWRMRRLAIPSSGIRRSTIFVEWNAAVRQRRFAVALSRNVGEVIGVASAQLERSTPIRRNQTMPTGHGSSIDMTGLAVARRASQDALVASMEEHRSSPSTRRSQRRGGQDYDRVLRCDVIKRDRSG